MKKKAIIFTTLLIGMISYITWIFYMSEPKYIDNAKAESQNNIEKYDVVNTVNSNGDVCIGVVIQIDNNFKNETRAIVKNFEHPYSNDAFTTIHLKDIIAKDSTKAGFTQDYRIIGKGTFYHKVNHFIGFNIMMTTNAFVIIMILIIGSTLIGIVREYLGYDEFW